MLDAETEAFLETGCGLLVGTVDPSGEPHAGRGWGLDVVGHDPVRVRLLLDGGDERTIENLAMGCLAAVTGADVRTLVSTQVKGRAERVEAATPDDQARAARYCDEFFTSIEETDGTERAICDRLLPVSFVAAMLAIEQVFDQTPGPGAGAQRTTQT